MENICPNCGDEMWREEVDIGVGTMCGPYHCSSCGWQECDPCEVYEWKEGEPVPF